MRSPGWMRRRGVGLPWQTCMKPPLRPISTCSADATANQFLLMGFLLDRWEKTIRLAAVRLCQQQRRIAEERVSKGGQHQGRIAPFENGPGCPPSGGGIAIISRWALS